MEKPALNPTKRARKHGRYIKQRRGSPCVLPDTDTTQDIWRTNEIIYYEYSSAYKWKCIICGITSWRSPAKTPRAHHDCIRLPSADDLHVYTDAKTRPLPPNNRYHPRASAWNQKVLKTKLLFDVSLPYTGR